MTFFDSVSDFFKDQVYGGFLKPAYENVLKPVVTGAFDIIKPVAGAVTGFVSPIVSSAGRLGGKIIDTGSRIVDTGGRFVEGTGQNLLNVEKGFANVLSSPLLYIGLGIVAIIVLPKLLD
jgi:phage-related protein